jgi:hypothetical protein
VLTLIEQPNREMTGFNKEKIQISNTLSSNEKFGEDWRR